MLILELALLILPNDSLYPRVITPSSSLPPPYSKNKKEMLSQFVNTTNVAPIV
ncbi:hypothetical protein COL91_21260 [Bacillus pseudomycoides]|nr:hypothetical protein COO02_24365 [Bacillus pseudomycoides]PGA87743.1 hypothetical protein COL91_21260 [Bacillus pseudomycoides]PHF46371.1 hypothetical protein COF72_12500 [Bacillus pseudomycoides]